LTCHKAAFKVPGTVFTRGTKFMNVDIAEMLETQYRIYGQRSD
jgi:hypothetical protein